jgi:uncharacterized damage-inducible protein DinB
MDALEPLRQLSAYNRWMNAGLYDACERLPAPERFAERGAFFGSIAGTLNHIVVGDSLWLRRFAAGDAGAPLREALAWLPAPTALNQRLYDDWAALRAMRGRVDALIEHWVNGLAPRYLDTVLAYRNSRGDEHRRRLGLLLAHFFNHQTHHRGQVTTLLSQAGIDPGVTDLVALLPQAEA